MEFTAEPRTKTGHSRVPIYSLMCCTRQDANGGRRNFRFAEDKHLSGTPTVKKRLFRESKICSFSEEAESSKQTQRHLRCKNLAYKQSTIKLAWRVVISTLMFTTSEKVTFCVTTEVASPNNDDK